jgi:hypothetical protein
MVVLLVVVVVVSRFWRPEGIGSTRLLFEGGRVYRTGGLDGGYGSMRLCL